MKKILISTFAVASIVLLSSCSLGSKTSVETKTDTMMPAENTMMKDDSAMMKKEDTTADGMMKADVKVESGAMMQK